MEKIKALILKLWEKFKALSLKGEFVFGFPFFVFASLAFILKSVVLVLILGVWTLIVLINNANPPEI